MTGTGVLRAIGLFPVKSVGGTSVDAADVGEDGLVGDRGFAVLDADGQVLRAKRVPGLTDLAVTGPAADPLLVVPGGVPLAQFLAVPGAHLAPVAGGARQVEAVHLVSLGQRNAPGAGDTSRANLVVDLVDEPAVEDWPGVRCLVGDVELEVVGVPRHCAGVFCAVVRPGPVHVGDAVRLLRGPLH